MQHIHVLRLCVEFGRLGAINVLEKTQTIRCVGPFSTCFHAFTADSNKTLFENNCTVRQCVLSIHSVNKRMHTILKALKLERFFLLLTKNTSSVWNKLNSQYAKLVVWKYFSLMIECRSVLLVQFFACFRFLRSCFHHCHLYDSLCF